jgi:hypothetical protein
MRSSCRMLMHATILSFCSCFLLVPCTFATQKRPRPLRPDEIKFLHRLGPRGGKDAGPVSSAPEPITLVLFGSGLLIIGGAMRRHDKKRRKATSLSEDNLRGKLNSSVAGNLLC